MRASHLPLVLVAFVSQVLAQSYFFPNGSFHPDNAVSSGCSTALQASLPCLPDVLFAATSDTFQPSANATYQKMLCDSKCGSSLASYIQNVDQACNNDPQPFTGLPPAYYGLQTFSAWNVTCLQDSTGQNCLSYLFGLFQNSTSATSIADLPESQLCRPCIYMLMQQVASTPFSNFNDALSKEAASIGQKCGVTLPTSVPASVGNLTSVSGYTPLGTLYNSTCLSGKTYTVVSGDTAIAISQKQSVSTGALLIINNLMPDGSDLQLGQTLCLPETCQSQLVQSGDTCNSIITAAGFQYQQFLAWNPNVNPYCTNLLEGQNVCVSPPSGVWTGTTIGGATVTKTNIYATSTVPPPGPTAHGTTTQCGKYYQVKSGDFCELVALNYTVDLTLFESINPSIDSGCDNLVPGLYYCVEPLQDWNSTDGSSTTSTYVSAPTQTPPGSTSDCFQWYTVQSGDSCSLIESSFGITMQQLQSWNPDLKADCSNLLLGEAYCVNSDDPVKTSAAKMARRTAGPVSVAKMEALLDATLATEKARIAERGVGLWSRLRQFF